MRPEITDELEINAPMSVIRTEITSALNDLKELSGKNDRNLQNEMSFVKLRNLAIQVYKVTILRHLCMTIVSVIKVLCAFNNIGNNFQSRLLVHIRRLRLDIFG